jgi:hypothetical protein
LKAVQIDWQAEQARLCMAKKKLEKKAELTSDREVLAPFENKVLDATKTESDAKLFVLLKPRDMFCFRTAPVVAVLCFVLSSSLCWLQGRDSG